MKAQRRQRGFGSLATAVLLAILVAGAWAQAGPEPSPGPAASEGAPAGDLWGAERPEGFEAPAAPPAEPAMPQPAVPIAASRSAVERVWQAPAESFEIRVDQTRRAHCRKDHQRSRCPVHIRTHPEFRCHLRPCSFRSKYQRYRGRRCSYNRYSGVCSLYSGFGW